MVTFSCKGGWESECLVFLVLWWGVVFVVIEVFFGSFFKYIRRLYVR